MAFYERAISKHWALLLSGTAPTIYSASIECDHWDENMLDNLMLKQVPESIIDEELSMQCRGVRRD
jgi:hypothetical protein